MIASRVSAALAMSDRRIAATLFVIALVIYGATSAPHVVGGDSGEFATLAATGGVGHPPGYPLYVLVLRALRWLPAVEPAHRASLITALIGSVNGPLFYHASRAWGASPVASVIATVTFMLAPLTWQLSTSPEAFALNITIALALVALAARTPDEPRGALRHAAALALLAGLGLANHHSIVLLAPIGLFAWAAAVRASKRPFSAVACSVAALFIGLLPYAYLVYAARTFDPATTWMWGDTKTLHGLVAHFLRREYGTLQLGISTTKPEIGAQMLAFLRATVLDLRAVPLLALVGATLVLKRAVKKGPSSARVTFRWFMLLTSIVVSGPLFLARFNLPPRGLHATVVERFYLLPWAILLVACARSLDGLSVPSARRFRWFVPAAIAVLMALASFDTVRERNRPTLSQYVHNVLGLVEPNAILVGGGDHRFGGFLYARLALGERRDVAFLNPRLMLGAWYPPQAEALAGRPLTRAQNQSLNAAQLLRELLATRRPTYLTDWVIDDFRKTVPTYPIGPIMRVVERGGFMPMPEQLYAMNDEAFARFDLEATPPRNAHSWNGDVFATYARPWQTLAEAFRPRDPVRAEVCRQHASTFTPSDAPP
jgi:hypothetical protein